MGQFFTSGGATAAADGADGADGAGWSGYDPWVAPATPGSLDDEFDDASFSGWTEIAVAGATAKTEAGGLLELTGVSDSIFFKAIPGGAGDLSFETAFLITASRANFTQVSTCFLQDAAASPATTDLDQISAQYGAAGEGYILLHQNLTAPPTYGANRKTGAARYVASPRLRVVRSGTTWYTLASVDGMSWLIFNTVTEAALGYIPKELGFRYLGIADSIVRVVYARYKPSAYFGPSGTLWG